MKGIGICSKCKKEMYEGQTIVSHAYPYFNEHLNCFLEHRDKLKDKKE